MNRIRHNGGFCQDQEAEFLRAANERLLAKREERKRLYPTARDIPIRTAAELVGEALCETDFSPLAILRNAYKWAVWADIESADRVSMSEPLANAIDRGIYTIGKNGERSPVTEDNWESLCQVITIDGHSFCGARLYWDGFLFGEGGKEA